MKILIVRSSSGEENNDPGFYIHLTLNQMGINNRLVEYESIIRKKNANILIKASNYFIQRYLNKRSNMFNITKQADSNLLKEVQEYRPDLILIMKGMYLRKSILKEIKQIQSSAKIFNYYSDNIFLCGTALRAAEYCDRIYLHDTYVIDKAKRIGLVHARQLWHACYPNEHRLLDDITEVEKNIYSCDISVIGSTYPYRAAMCEILHKHNFKVWGNIWGFSSQRDLMDTYMYKCHQGSTADGRKKTIIYNLSKINLNTMQPVECVHGSNSRVHQVSACQQFQLHEYNPDLEAQYNIGEEIIVFRNREELKELTDYYLKNENERREIAKKAYKRAISDHTFQNRINTIIDDFEKMS